MQEEEGAPPLGFDEIAVERESGGGGGGGGGSPAGNRWPRQETTALLKIRSDMDPLFQEATLKAPLWELISRKLREEGFQRSAKKCKEKFENVFKYYKRTKEARAGKSYRFFSQLEAFRTSAAAAAVLPPPIMSGSDTMVNFEPTSSGAAAAAAPPQHTLFSITDPPPPPPPPAAVSHITTPVIAPPPTDGPSSSSNPSSYSGTESENESRRKRKRKLHSGDEAPPESSKMMAFFEGLIQKVIDQQEKMLQKFLEAIERREQNRMIREEAWRRQEKSRLSKEHELAAEERAAAASRDDAIVSFLQKLTGQKIPFPPPPPPSPTAAGEEETPTPTPPPPETHPVPAPKVTPLSSSRWPKPEVHALIKLRSGMELRYQESIPKGPLWEEISSGMLCLGYNRSAKRCKEKWENINKYFKKVKESTKSRRDDAKTCHYFHQLDALYRNKLTGGDGGGGGSSAAAEDRLSSVLAVKKKTL